MTSTREFLIVLFLLLRCKWRGTHAPMLTIGDGWIYLRCASCELRTDGVEVYRA